MERFKNKYRIASARATWWDYGWNAAYFITICTKNRQHYFGSVVNGKMDLSIIGHFADSCWYDIPNHFPFVELGDFVVMPNHIHGIIIINKSNDGRNVVEAQNLAPLQPTSPKPPPDKPKNKFGPQSKNLASIVRGYKIGVTKNGRKTNPDFAWQPRYHDHIIRNDTSYKRISDYIINNPNNWREDKFFSS